MHQAEAAYGDLSNLGDSSGDEDGDDAGSGSQSDEF